VDDANIKVRQTFPNRHRDVGVSPLRLCSIYGMIELTSFSTIILSEVDRIGFMLNDVS
jgi:hypothetical protein